MTTQMFFSVLIFLLEVEASKSGIEMKSGGQYIDVNASAENQW
jgi:hypothetical protein